MAKKLARTGKGKLTINITEEQTKSGSTAIFGPVRNSYMAVFKTRKNKKRGNAEEYSNVILIEKGDDELLDFIQERIDHALVTVFKKVIAKYESCLRDGDKDINEEGDPVYPGFMYISTRSDADQPPLLYKPGSRVPLDVGDAANWVSGDWGNIKLDFFGYDNENKGVSTRMKALQFTAKDVAFGRTPQDADKVADEFGDVEDVEAQIEREEGTATATRKKSSYLD